MRMVNDTFKTLQRFASKLMFMTACIVVFINSNVEAQDCPLACNNLVQVSLDFECKAVITPDIILEGEDDELFCDYFIRLYDQDGNLIDETSYLPGPVTIHPSVDGAQMNETIDVEIFTDNVKDDFVDLTTANNCWGSVVIEDKIPTQIICPDDFSILCVEDISTTMLLNQSSTSTYNSDADLDETILASTTETFTVTAVNQAYGFELVTGVEVCVTLDPGNVANLEVSLEDPSGAVVTAPVGPTGLCFDIADFNLVQASDENISGDWLVHISNVGPASMVVDAISITIESESALSIDYAGDNCNNTSIQITGDEFLDYDCRPDANPYTMQREITWTATDESGNQTECSFIISYEKGDLADVVMPADILINAEDDDYSASGLTLLGADGRRDCGIDLYNNGMLDPTPSLAGVPMLGGHPLFPMALDNVCKFNVSYDDQFTQTCGSNFKILRTFYVYDWCNAQVTEFRQTIKSKDEVGPAQTTFYGVLTTSVDADAYACSSDITIDFESTDFNNSLGGTLNLGGILGDCSGTEVYEACYLEANPDGSQPATGTPFNCNDGRVIINGDGTFTFLDMQGPRVWIKFHVQDECGNRFLFPTVTGEELASITVEVDIIDNIPPVAVCDEYTAVTLNENGWGRVYAPSLDDGSHDYCIGDLTYEVRRTTGVSSGHCINGVFDENNDFAFGEFIQVCCDDLGTDVEVELRVTDASGNSAICTVIVRPQSLFGEFSSNCSLNSAPGSDVDNDGNYDTSYQVDCDDYASGYATDIPSVQFSGPCDVSLSPFSRDREILTQCGDYFYGTVVREWFVKVDGADVNLDCDQTISVGYFPDLSDCVDPDAASCNIDWPNDRLNVPGCTGADADPDNFGDFPKYSLTGAAIDQAPGCGMLAYTYTDQYFSDVEDACFKIIRTWTVIDWCLYSTTDPTPEGIYTNTQIIKLNNTDAPIFIELGGIDAMNCVAADDCEMSLTLTASAKDACTDNTITTTSRYNYTLRNTTTNTVVASGNGTSITRTLSIGSYRITWSVEGACGVVEEDSFSFTVNDCTAPVPYCKGGITTAILPGANEVEVWASDLDLNSADSCDDDLLFTFANGQTNMVFTCDDIGVNTVTIYVEDDAGNSDFCVTSVTIQANSGACDNAARVMIAGNIATENATPITDVEVALEHMTDASMTYENTLTDGHYAFEDMQSYVDYHLTADMIDEPRNGISTLDIVLIQRHILNLESLDSPYKLIAADANNNEEISAADMVDIRKLILHVIDEYPNNRAWRFVDANATYADENHPWPLQEDVLLNSIAENAMNVNWIGVKVGDVNGSVILSGATDGNVESRTSEALQLEVIETEAGVYQIVSRTNIELSGLQLAINADAITTVGQGAINFNDRNIAMTENTLAISYDNVSGVAITEGSVLFTVQAQPNVTMTINDVISAEAYSMDLDVMDIEFVTPNAESDFALFQNVPNPFTTSTSIAFALPRAGFATVEVLDINGRVLYSLNQLFDKGLNNTVVEASMLPASGVVYYRLQFEGSMETRKMILLD